MDIKLYEYTPSRSAQVRWTLLELDVPFESRNDRALIGSVELRAIHPLAKLPAIVADGRPLFESAAICTWLADTHADKGLISPSGTWERALHDQWVSFASTEVEAYLWSSARNTFVLPKEKRLPAVFAQNNAELERTLPVLDAHLAAHQYFVDDRFSVTDIIVGNTINWARITGRTDGFTHLNAYLRRLQERPFCPYEKESSD